MLPPLARSLKPPAPSDARFISQDGGLRSYSEPTFQTQREGLEGMRGPHFRPWASVFPTGHTPWEPPCCPGRESMLPLSCIWREGPSR